MITRRPDLISVEFDKFEAIEFDIMEEVPG